MFSDHFQLALLFHTHLAGIQFIGAIIGIAELKSELQATMHISNLRVIYRTEFTVKQHK